VSKICTILFFCNNFVKLRSFWQFLAHIHLSKFPIRSIFLILHKVQSSEPV